MDQQLADRFAAEQPRLRSLAYRMLGSVADADDAVQDVWLRLRGVDGDRILNLEAWLTTTTSRVCLNVLRSRQARKEEPLDGFASQPIISADEGGDPEHEALLGDAVGVALQVVLESLRPAERLAFVLHDLFAVPFDEIATLLQRSTEATRQLASRARRRVREEAPEPDVGLAGQRAVVDAYFAAARDGDLDALIVVLDPEVVLRAHRRDGVVELRGSRQVADGALAARAFAPFVRPALVNGSAGVVAFDGEVPFAILAFSIRGGRAVAIDVFNDRELVPAIVAGRPVGRR